MAATDLPEYAHSIHQGRRGSPLRPLHLLRVEALGVTPVDLHLHLSKPGSAILSSLLSTSLNHRNPVDPVDSSGFPVDSTRLHYSN